MPDDDQRYDIMSMVSNPDDFLAWPETNKMKWYQKVIEWHDYIARLQRNGLVGDAWGTQSISGMTYKVATKTSLIAMYHTTFDQYSELITEDPLYNYGVYHAPILKSIEGDYEDDLARYHRIRARLLARGKVLPEPAIEFLDANAIPNINPGGKVQVLFGLSGTPFYPNLPEERKLELDELVLQMHQYHRILRDRGIIIREWGCYQYLGHTQEFPPAPQAGRSIVQVNSYREFDQLFLLDPLVLSAVTRTIVLVPFEASRERAKVVLENAKRELN
jgi:hypothetical protein